MVSFQALDDDVLSEPLLGDILLGLWVGLRALSLVGLRRMSDLPGWLIIKQLRSKNIICTRACRSLKRIQGSGLLRSPTEAVNEQYGQGAVR